jgi:hypothetical protein
LHCQQSRSGEIFSFNYNEKWLTGAEVFEFDPDLALVPGHQYPASDRANFGIFLDSAPDRWGRVLMQRRENSRARGEGRRPRTLTEWDFLLGVHDETRLGALRFLHVNNYLYRVLKPLAEGLGLEKLNFQILRRTMATQAQKMGSVKDIQAHLRHSRPDTTAHEYMQELPESVHQMVGSVYLMLTKGGEGKKVSDEMPQNAANAFEVTLVSN